MSFGERFGQLVRRYREAQGLSSGELAAEAFGDEARKSRISELENGKVKAPQAKTIDALRIALAIPQEDIDALRTPPSPVDHDLTEIVDRIRTEMDLSTNGLLENLAQRFGIDNPDAPRAKLESFLKDKAKEWQALRERLASLTELDERLSNQMAAAESALSQGHFDEAEEILSNAEAIQQQERTLAEVRKQSQIRATRAEAALLKGDQNQSYRHFKASADMFTSFDPIEGAKVRREHYVALYQTGLQFPGPALAHAADLARDNLSAYVDPAHAEDRGKTLNNLAIFLQFQGIRTDGPEGAELLAQAVQAYREALQIRTRTDIPADWAMTQNNLGIALQEQSLRTDGPQGADLLAQAVQAYRDALQIRTRADMPADWAQTQNNLGIALHVQGIRTDGPKGADLLAEAVQANREALHVRTRADMPADWAMTQHNLANTLQTQGSRTDGPEGAALLAQAVQAYREALQVRTRADMPAQWALTQNNLGAALWEQGRRTDGPEGADLLAQAVQACREALQVHTRADMPVQWAETHVNLGEAFEAMADRQAGAERDADLTQALTHLDAALQVFHPDTMSLHFQECSETRNRVAAKLAGTWVDEEGSE